MLGLGYVGRNINPVGALTHNTLPALPGAQMPAQNTVCAEPFPNAIIRLERIRDNPGTPPTLLAASSAAISPIPLAMIFGPWCYLTLVRVPCVIPLRPAVSAPVRML